MQWDHRPGCEKLGDISADFWGKTRDEVLTEVAKCDLVCANCHAIRTFERSGWALRWLTELIPTSQTSLVQKPRELPRQRQAQAARVVAITDADGRLRLCARCREWKTAGEFHNSRTGQFSYCRDCRREYDRSYYAERGRSARRARQRVAIDAARAWMAELKAGRPCCDCGGVFPVYVMHWDHLPGFAKVGEISVMVTSRTREAVLAELEKCELVCANCHVMRTVTGHNAMLSSVAI